MKKHALCVLFLCALGFPLMTAKAAAIKLATPFSDHMVLQRDAPVPVWGWADAGAQVTVEFAGQKKTVAADAQGKWMIRLDSMPAAAEPRAMRISAGGAPAVVVNDVLVGEVWLGSGQSNMAMMVRNARDFEQETAAAHLPLIRVFKEESGPSREAQAEGKGVWQICSPETVGGFSAT